MKINRLNNFFNNFLKNEIFGDIENTHIKPRIFILMCFITLILIIIGTITNLLLEISYWANVINVISFIVVFQFYRIGKKNKNIDRYTMPLFYVSIFLLGFAWITNGGYNSNITLLIFIYFFSLSSILDSKKRKNALYIYLTFYSILVVLSYYFPSLIIPYDNDYQRFIDILLGGIIYFIFIYHINKIIIEAYDADNNKLSDINKKLAASQEKYQSLYNTMPVGYYKTTAGGKFVEANPAFIQMLGYGNFDELSKIDIRNELYYNSDDRSSLLENNNEFNNEIEIYQLKRKDGSLIWIEDNPRYIKGNDGEILFHEGLCKDITQRVEYENKIKENEKTLKELNDSKDKFFSIIAHDLKNPLSSIRDLSGILYNEYENLNEDDKKEFLEAIKISTNQVYNLLENLLEWSRTQRDLIKYNPEFINLNLIVNKVIDIFAVNLTNKNIKISNLCNDDIIVYSDVNILNTILRNLVSNSIKFTPNNGEIIIGINSNIESQKNVIEVYVKDNGLGIDNNLLQNVFKIENTKISLGTNGEKGTGLGLVLVKELVGINKGEISIESEVNKGTKVNITIPITNE